MRAGALSPSAALLLVLAVWGVLLAGRAAAPRVGVPAAAVASFGLAAALVHRVRSPRAEPLPPARWRALAMLLGAVSGYALFAAGLALTWRAGLALGLRPEWLDAPVAPGAGGPALWLAGVVLAPAFEEPLYRGHLLRALRGPLSTPLAVGFTSVLFALPHLRPWKVWGSLLGGLFLGALACLGRSTGLCVAFHAGLNAAAVARGIPPERPQTLAAAAGCVALAAALWLLRRRPSAAREVTPAPSLVPAWAPGGARAVETNEDRAR